MTEADFIRSIALFWQYADGMGVGQVFSNPVSIKLSEEYRKEAYSAGVNYESLYLTGLRNSDYNIQLVDYSFLQFSFDGRKIRLAYFPNPFFGASPKVMMQIGENHEYLLEGLLDIETFLQEIAEARASEIPPLLRYEYDEDAYINLSHPSSHLHVGYHSDNRWPVERILTPDAFGLLILKLYYRSQWEKAKPLRYGDSTASADFIFMSSKGKCPITSADKFSPDERKQFFLG